MSDKAPPLQVEQFREYHAVLGGKDMGLTAEFVVNDHARQHPESDWVLIMPGLGEGDRTAKHAVGVLDELSVPAVALNLPLDDFEPSAANLIKVVTELPVAFAESRNLETGNPGDKPVHLMGNSQGGGAVIMTASEAPERYGVLAAIRPVGLNRQAFGIKPDKHKATPEATGISEHETFGVNEEKPPMSELLRARLKFIARLGIENAALADQMPVHTHRPRFDIGNVLGQYEILSNIIRSKKAHSLMGKLDTALQLDLADKVLKLRQDHNTTIWIGDRDPVFRLSEIVSSLGRYGCDAVDEGLLIPFHGSHSALMSNAGTRQLKMVGQHVKNEIESNTDNSPLAA